MSVAAPPSALSRLRRGGRRYPEYGAVLAIALAWLAVVAHHATATATHHHHAGAAAPRDLPLWTVMCVAMMVPTALPAVRHVATNSLRWRRQRAIAGFLAAYLAVWVAFGLVVLPALALARGRLPGDGDAVLAVALGAAAAWLLMPYQRGFLAACHRTVPLPPTGWRAAAGCARFGLRHGAACLGACWPLMLVMAVVLHESLLWMVALAAITIMVRLMPRSDRVSGPVAVLLGAFAVSFLVVPAA